MNRKNWRITIKLHFKNLGILFKKANVHTWWDSPSPCLFLFAFQWLAPHPLLNERTFWMTPSELSSIVKWGYQDNFKLVFVFFTKRFPAHKKHSQANINQQDKIKQTLKNKGNNFSRAQTSKRVKVACFAFWCFLCARNLFVKKEINKQAWNCLDNLILLYFWNLILLYIPWIVMFLGFTNTKVNKNHKLF